MVLFIYMSSFSVQPSIEVCNQSEVDGQVELSNISLNTQCSDKGNEVSWIAWVTNKSSSNQFHFLDLLELLSKFKSDNK